MADVTDLQRYDNALHAMQTGIAMLANYEPSLYELKHLRVGVNSALVSENALATLLISKGIITLAEYEKAQADAAEREVRMYEGQLSGLLGQRIVLI